MTNLKALWQFDICLTVSQPLHCVTKPLCHNHCSTTTVSQPLCHNHCVITTVCQYTLRAHCVSDHSVTAHCARAHCVRTLRVTALFFTTLFTTKIWHFSKLETDDRQKNMGLRGCTAEVLPKNLTLLKITNFVLLTSKKDFFDKNQESATWTSS